MAQSEHLTAIAEQLSCPSGEQGLDIAQVMHQTNIQMTRAAFQALQLKAAVSVLELGHGNAAHLPELQASVADMHYLGLEISPLMQQQAIALNQAAVTAQRAEFCCYDGDTLPDFAQPFDGIFCVNTIYFWRDALPFLRQLHRCLKPTGRLSIAYMSPEFLATLPFVDERFQHYEPASLQALLKQAGFQHLASQTLHDTVPRKDNGVAVARTFYVTIAMP